MICARLSWCRSLAQAMRLAASLARASAGRSMAARMRSEEHTSELQSLAYLVCRLLLEKKKIENSLVRSGSHYKPIYCLRQQGLSRLLRELGVMYECRDYLSRCVRILPSSRRSV